MEDVESVDTIDIVVSRFRYIQQSVTRHSSQKFGVVSYYSGSITVVLCEGLIRQQDCNLLPLI